ncbi:lipopolysaccharide biosynthesis protein [Cellulophaga omnivescoria]|uniref:lipopolysaccharide biosynthesis protein n=1 Tax=Cellulophaga omnivescoria TaxID=1888890 RepID=UPI0009854F36|nr:oligosaccharide flippase family protein [Cellulophaga omnivescoria]WBU91024.1 oligosaccharide flippase family protein [Cellulophaga omnivescoria]
MSNISDFFKSTKSLGRDVLILSVGILLAQVIPLLLQPFLKRTFSPEDFGTYDVFLKSFSILVALSSLKYENAILLPKKDTDSKHVLYLSVIISTIICLLLFIIILIFKNRVHYYFKEFSFLAMCLLPISVYSYSIFNTFNMYLIRKQRFLLSSSSKVSRRFSEGLIQFLFGYFKNPNGLLIGDTIGNTVQGAFSFWKVRSMTSLKNISLIRIKKVMYEYRELPVFTLIPNILNTFVLGSLTFLILSKFDIKEVGYLEFTQKILAIPSVFISIAISQVVFQRVSQLINKKEKILPLLLSVILMLLSFSTLFILLIQFYGEEIFVFIGGEGWENSGKYAKILVYGSAIMLIFSPLGKVLIALKKFKINSLWEISKFAVVLFLFYADGLSLIMYLKLYTWIILLFYLIYGVIIIYMSYKYQIEEIKAK